MKTECVKITKSLANEQLETNRNPAKLIAAEWNIPLENIDN